MNTLERSEPLPQAASVELKIVKVEPLIFSGSPATHLVGLKVEATFKLAAV